MSLFVVVVVVENLLRIRLYFCIKGSQVILKENGKIDLVQYEDENKNSRMKQQQKYVSTYSAIMRRTKKNDEEVSFCNNNDEPISKLKNILFNFLVVLKVRASFDKKISAKNPSPMHI